MANLPLEHCVINNIEAAMSSLDATIVFFLPNVSIKYIQNIPPGNSMIPEKINVYIVRVNILYEIKNNKKKLNEVLHNDIILG